MTKQETITDTLLTMMSDALPAMPVEESLHLPFLEMGANSLVLMEVQRNVENKFGVNISINQFFDELTNIEALAHYISENGTVETAEAPAAEAAPVVSAPVTPAPVVSVAPTPVAPIASTWQAAPIVSVASNELEQILQQQLHMATETINQVVAQQLAFLGTQGAGQLAAAPTTQASTPAAAPTASAKPASPAPAKATETKSNTSPQHLLSPLEIRARGLTPVQQTHLEDLIARYVAKTKTSKQLAQQYRGVLADSRATVGFRFTTKEMLYPVVGERAEGCRIWDVDGHEYIDITMGQGVNLFGHQPEFINKALNEATRHALPGPPRIKETCEAAALISELTGLDRVAFTNSGTEAVMAAIRLARAATKRNKILMFEGSYHGHSDFSIAKSNWDEHGNLVSSPLSAGIPAGAVQDTLLLPYGEDSSLDYIRQHVHEFAAIIVEPVQSRRPDLQPREFVKELRKLTEAAGTLLIFDEMVTGFRTHPNGAQEWYGVKADLATYGKVLGGGLPVGVVAGSSRCMDGIDGGMWQYGDSSYPVAERTVFGGTFCQHPLAMATTLATLKKLKAEGAALQEAVNRRTTYLADSLNAYFAQEEMPLKVVHFASLFRFSFTGNLELLFYHLMLKGVFVWEWRNCFLSTAHTDADVERVIQAVKESLEEMRAGGFIPPKSGTKSANIVPLKPVAQTTEQVAPLSEAQRQLWTLAQITPQGSLAYHIRVTLQLDGALNLDALQKAIQQLIARHEALRTVIRSEGQVILPQLTINVPLVDCSQDADSAEQWLQQELSTPFNLSEGPLFRATVLKFAEQQHRLVFNAHHIVVDGMSINVIARDTAALYSALVQNQAVNLPEPAQFRAQNQSLTEQLNTENMRKHEQYWLEQFAGTLPTLTLPADFPPPAFKSYHGGRESLRLPPSLCAAVRQFSRRQNCTPFMTYFAAYSILLHRLSGQTEVVVGIPTLGRNIKNSEHMVGYCTHLLPIKSQVTDYNQPFTEFLTATRRVLLNGYQHQEYPYANLLNHLRQRRDTGHSPLVSTVFNIDQPGEVPPMHGLQTEWLPQPVLFTAFDLTFNLTEVGEESVLECHFDADLFSAETVQRWLGHYETLLSSIVDHAEQSVYELAMMNAEQQQQLLVEWNQTATDYPKDKTIAELLTQQAEANADALALSFGEQQLTFRELNQRANQLAHHLQQLGVKPETTVGICLRRSPELIISLWAVLKAGGAYVPLDPSYPAARLAFMLEDSQTPIVLTQAALAPELPQTAAQVIAVDQDAATWAQQPNTNPASAATPDSLAYLIYTSGSTGKPKGTMIRQQGLVNYLTWAVNAYEVAQGNGVPVHASISFDATITSLFTASLAGKPMMLLPEKNHEAEVLTSDLLDLLNTQQALSLVKLTPAHLELLNPSLNTATLSQQCRYVILGGEALTTKQVALWRQHAPNIHLINEYGPTETVVGCCVYEVNADTPEVGQVPIGRPIANTQLYVLDPTQRPVPVGVMGELYIGGDGVARGYLNRPELTTERFIRDPFTDDANARLYRTGDLARYLADGTLEYLGRVDNQVKVRGFRVELGEIETVLAALPAVREAAVIAHQFSAQDTRLIAYAAPDAGQSLSEHQLREKLVTQLPAHMVPSVIVVLDSLPLTPNGKIDRKALPIPDSARPQLSADFVSPTSSVEQQLAAIWQGLLHLEQVGVNDNFFDLGGHSLLVLPMCEQIEQQLNCQLSPVDVFKYPTIRTLAASLQTSGSEQPQPAQNSKHQKAKQRGSRQKQAFQKMAGKR